MNTLAKRVHAFTGGSADLAPSTKTILKGHGDYAFGEYGGHNLHFGIREHAMGAVANGMALHRGIIPYTATFLIFSDYMRPPMRLAALMGQRVIYLFTHDSIGLGEDGSDPSARRAAPRPSSCAQPGRNPARRRLRDRGGVEGRDDPA